jgi:WhiB family transcriptional regulator, redox-sensing transcriptional regulator
MPARTPPRAPDEPPSPTTWWEHTACLDENPEVFCPLGTNGPAPQQIEQAKAYCQSCPVCTQRLDWALATGQADGVWGGTSEDERRQLRRNRHRQTR